jgi:hypothetical protein
VAVECVWLAVDGAIKSASIEALMNAEC